MPLAKWISIQEIDNSTWLASSLKNSAVSRAFGLIILPVETTAKVKKNPTKYHISCRRRCVVSITGGSPATPAVISSSFPIFFRSSGLLLTALWMCLNQSIYVGPQPAKNIGMDKKRRKILLLRIYYGTEDKKKKRVVDVEKSTRSSADIGFAIPWYTMQCRIRERDVWANSISSESEIIRTVKKFCLFHWADQSS